MSENGGPMRDMRVSPIRRRCLSCQTWKPIRGGTSGKNGKGFRCAKCRPQKPAREVKP
jgi:hypothetical protein